MESLQLLTTPLLVFKQVSEWEETGDKGDPSSQAIDDVVHSLRWNKEDKKVDGRWEGGTTANLNDKHFILNWANKTDFIPLSSYK